MRVEAGIGKIFDRRSECFSLVRPFINLLILPQLVKKMKLADIMTILGSIDIIMGEVDH